MPIGRSQRVTQALFTQIRSALPQSLSRAHDGVASQRPVVMLQTGVAPLHWRPPIWPQPGTHWVFSQTVLGGMHWLSMAHVVGSCVQRPVFVLQTSRAPHSAAFCEQPGTHAPLMQMVEGGVHPGSPLHMGVASAGPVPPSPGSRPPSPGGEVVASSPPATVASGAGVLASPPARSWQVPWLVQNWPGAQS
jgi:hypothetical protein